MTGKPFPTDPQPPPTPGREPVFPVARAAILAMMDAQHARGLAKYGVELHTWNGRNPHADARAELVDALQYVTQAEMERADLERENAALRARLSELDARGAMTFCHGCGTAGSIEVMPNPPAPVPEPFARAVAVAGAAVRAPAPVNLSPAFVRHPANCPECKRGPGLKHLHGCPMDSDRAALPVDAERKDVTP